MSSTCCVNPMITPIRIIDQVDYGANWLNNAPSTTIIVRTNLHHCTVHFGGAPSVEPALEIRA